MLFLNFILLTPTTYMLEFDHLTLLLFSTVILGAHRLTTCLFTFLFKTIVLLQFIRRNKPIKKLIVLREQVFDRMTVLLVPILSDIRTALHHTLL